LQCVGVFIVIVHCMNKTMYTKHNARTILLVSYVQGHVLCADTRNDRVQVRDSDRERAARREWWVVEWQNE
jgi:hypothetical protein